MEFETPRLDDRSFQDLVAEARQRIALYTPEWTDHNPSDPGMALVELFAFMTDVALYRMNRVPEKTYIKLMQLLGMQLREAEPARVPVTFWLSSPQPITMTIPVGTQVATTRTETEKAIIFSTDATAEILVPKIEYVLASSGSTGEGRAFSAYSVADVLNGRVRMPAFPSTPPVTGDAFYIGFEEDLSHHIISLQLDVSVAEGSGIDPTRPPYVFEVLSMDASQSWVEVEVEKDETQALNVSGVVRMYLPRMRRAPRSDKMSYWLRCRLDQSRVVEQYQRSPTITRIQAQSWGITIPATHVTRVNNEILGRSDGSPGQTFLLQNVPLVARTINEYIVVKLDNGTEERWYEVADFASATPDDKVYTINSQTGEVRFGPALPQRDGTIRRFGAIPPQGSLIAMRQYRYGGGVVGNVAPLAINVLKSSIPYIARVVNRQSAVGGMDAENVPLAKERVPHYLRTLNRAVTATDFEYLAHEASPGQIGRVFCLQPPLTSRGEVNLLIIPSVARLQGFISPESLYLSPDLRDRVQQYLDERRLLSTRLQVMSPSYQWVETEVRVKAARHQDVERVRQVVEQRLFEFLNPLIGGADGKGWPFGRDLYVSDIIAVLLAVPEVDLIRHIRLYPVTYREGDFIREPELTELPVASHGVIISYRHTVQVEG